MGGEGAEQLAEGGRSARLQQSSPVPPDGGLAYREAVPPQTLRTWQAWGQSTDVAQQCQGIRFPGCGCHWIPSSLWEPGHGGKGALARTLPASGVPPGPDTSCVCREGT